MTPPSARRVEAVAKAMYEDDHKHMPNCWKWADSGLDDEHPGVRERYLRQARVAVAASDVVLAEEGLVLYRGAAVTVIAKAAEDYYFKHQTTNHDLACAIYEINETAAPGRSDPT